MSTVEPPHRQGFSASRSLPRIRPKPSRTPQLACSSTSPGLAGGRSPGLAGGRWPLHGRGPVAMVGRSHAAGRAAPYPRERNFAAICLAAGPARRRSCPEL